MEKSRIHLLANSQATGDIYRSEGYFRATLRTFIVKRDAISCEFQLSSPGEIKYSMIEHLPNFSVPNN
jgi:hypothetical protein